MQPIHANFMSLVLKLYIYICVCVCSHLISPCCSPCWWVFLRFSISSPGDSKFAFKKPTQGWTITQGPLSRAHCFKLKKWMAAKKNKQKHMNTRHEHAWTPMGTHEHLSTHEHPWAMSTHKFTWIPLNVHGSVMCSNKKSAGNLHVEPHVSQF